jgi:deoxyadenosine/deoxycytidine kinase
MLAKSGTDLPFKATNPTLRKYGAALRGKVLILEGLISAGKSTAGTEITSLVQSLGIPCRFFPEPIIPELLALFLADQPKYAFAFQLTMLVKRQAIYREAYEYAKKGYFCIIDRSIHGDYCFATMHKNRHNITELEWTAYLSTLHAEKFDHPDYVVYLEVSPQTAIRRCAIRDRKGETSYDIQYFTDLCQIYSTIIPQSPCKQHLIIDWNQDRTNEEITTVILNRVKEAYDSL